MPEPRRLCWTRPRHGDPSDRAGQKGEGGEAKTSTGENKRGGIITLNNSQLAGFAHPPLKEK